jgi:hypothetical protein
VSVSYPFTGGRKPALGLNVFREPVRNMSGPSRQTATYVFGGRIGNGLFISLYLLLCFMIMTIFHVVHGAGVDVTLIGSEDERNCDTEYGKHGSKQCLYAHLRLPHDDLTTLVGTLDELDSNNLVRRIFMKVHMHDTNASALAVDTQLDVFLTPKPWWLIISEEPQARDAEEHKYVYNVYLLRYTQLMEGWLRLIANIQYPPTEADCAQTPLKVVRYIGKGWGSQMTLMGGDWGSNMDKIHNIWDSYTNDAHGKTPYLSGDACPNVINKHECAYLSLTNCTMPTVLTSAKGLEALTAALPSDSQRFNSASASGVPVGVSNTAWKGPQRVQALISSFELDHGRYRVQPSSKFIDARGRLIHGQNGISQPEPRYILPALGFMYRERAPYRRLVHTAVSKFRNKYEFPVNFGDRQNCVSIHIRRGDRVHDNIKEFCKQFRRFEENGTCVNFDEPSKPCERGVSDFGCFSEHAYATLSLTDYLERAAALTDTPIHSQSNTSMTVFIMTDDAKWLTEELTQLGIYSNVVHSNSTNASIASSNPFQNWRILAVPARFDGHSGHEDQHVNHETDSGVEFLASVQLLRTCPNFVGHFGSGLTVALSHMLCFQHGASSTANCPNIYDVGYAYSDDGHQLWLPPMNIPRGQPLV